MSRREMNQEVPFSDLVDLIDAFYAMWNTQHIDGVLSFFTDDAIIITVGDPREAPAVYAARTRFRTSCGPISRGGTFIAEVITGQVPPEWCGWREFQRTTSSGWASIGSIAKRKPLYEMGRSRSTP